MFVIDLQRRLHWDYQKLNNKSSRRIVDVSHTHFVGQTQLCFTYKVYIIIIFRKKVFSSFYIYYSIVHFDSHGKD